jgi:Ca-activated chloride channel homolog
MYFNSVKRILFAAIYLLSIFISHNAIAQYYIKGRVYDAVTRTVLSQVNIQVPKSNIKHSTDYDGSFGIMANVTDSITFTLDGYETRKTCLKNQFNEVLLNPLNEANNSSKLKFVTYTKDYNLDGGHVLSFGNESYFNIIENETMQTSYYPSTSFSLNTNKASYSNIRRIINNKQMAPADVIKIEEMLNYFNQRYTEEKSTTPFQVVNYTSACPWDISKKLLHLQIIAKDIESKHTKPNKLTFLIDCSGSMDEGNRLPIIQAAFKMLAKQLTKNDTLTLVTFGSNVITWLENVAGTEHSKIIPVIDSLGAMGDTPGELALITAYNKALKYYNPNANNRIIICTDGDFNVGYTEEEELEKLVSKYKESGIYLTCLGIGRGNFKSSKLEALVKKGNGNFAYIDSEAEAEKLLIKEGLQTLVSIADNVSMQVIFKKDIIESYRLLGFDNQLKNGLERVNELEGGSVGSGHVVNALFEIAFTHNNIPNENDVIADATLHFELPNDKNHVKHKNQIPITYLAIIPKDVQPKINFNNGVALLGLVLRNSPFKKSLKLQDVKKYFETARIEELYLQQDLHSLIEKAIKIYPKKFKR